MNKDTIARFWDKVVKTDACWLWTASTRTKGYGAFVWTKPDGGVVQGRAHRFAWELANGPIPESMCVLHRCDVPACVRPDHLFLGTKADNNADMVSKGRHVPGGTHSGHAGYERGESHHNARLTADRVKEIRAEHAAGSSLRAIGIKHGIALGHASRIVNRKAWAHVE